MSQLFGDLFPFLTQSGVDGCFGGGVDVLFMFCLSFFSANFTKSVLRRLLHFVKNKPKMLIKAKAVNVCLYHRPGIERRGDGNEKFPKDKVKAKSINLFNSRSQQESSKTFLEFAG